MPMLRSGDPLVLVCRTSTNWASSGERVSWLSACSKVGPAGSRPREEKEKLQRICGVNLYVSKLAPFLHVLNLRNNARARF